MAFVFCSFELRLEAFLAVHFLLSGTHSPLTVLLLLNELTFAKNLHKTNIDLYVMDKIHQIRWQLDYSQVSW
jgi:hypothetical protein